MALSLALLAIAPAPAHALDVATCPSCADPENEARVVNVFERLMHETGVVSGVTFTPDGGLTPPPGGWEAQADDDLHALVGINPVTAGGTAVAAQFVGAAQSAGAAPAAAPAGATTIVLGAAAFTTGWVIGNVTRQMFYEFTAPAAPSGYPSPQLHRHTKGGISTIESKPYAETSYHLTWIPASSGVRTEWEWHYTNPDSTCPNNSGAPPAPFNPWAPGAFVDPACLGDISPLGGRNQVAGSRTGYVLPPAKKKGKLRYREGAEAGLGTTPPVGSAPSRGDLADDVEEYLNGPGATLGEWFESVFNESAPDPTENLAIVPSCDGLTWTTCGAELQEVGFVNRTNRIATPAEADLTKPAGAVIELDPPAGSEVSTATEIEVVTNPDPLPVEIPQIEPGETYEAYADRLTDLGLLGSAEVLSETLLDPNVGPDQVSRTSPMTGTRVAPGSEVKVYVNPSSAPEVENPTPNNGTPGTGAPPAGAGDCGPDIPAINLSPLNVPLGDVFPFAIFSWLYNALGGWNTGGSAPSFTLPFTHGELVFDFATFEPAMEVMRPILVLLSLFSLAWLFASAALGFGGAATNED